MKALLWVAGGILGITLAGAAAGKAASEPDTSKFSKIAALMKEKCLACHSRDFALPFYARFPGVREIIEKDFNGGLRAMDLNIELVEETMPVGEAAIAKMEWVVTNNTMPPERFAAAHWGSRLSDAEKEDILEWVKTTRAAHYATGSAAADKANEPLQPLPEMIPVAPEKAALGETLFNDKRLSADNTVACVSCHEPDKARADNLRFPRGIRNQTGDINTPTIYNAAFNIRQFWNGRAADLRAQASWTPFNPLEMGSRNWAEIIAKLAEDEELTARFKAVYPDGWSGEAIVEGIAEYEKTLLTPNSRFDKWLKGQEDALSADEVRGYALFKAYRCASCHVGKTVGGQSFEYMDLKQDYFDAAKRRPLVSDAGLKGVTKKSSDLHKFKVPNLRNVELTAPYLHDGSVNTLDEAVLVMGTYLSGMDIPPGDRLLVVRFLRALTGEFRGGRIAGQIVPK
ncbi:MAG: cytochrome-c peroxidase [Desulfovibrio sp.]|nr:cytochrome-c peroxidase [Desulfovibrio sp.]